jgi:hypothetical protein
VTKTYRIYLDSLQTGQPTYVGLGLRTAKSYARQLRERGFAEAHYAEENV